MKDMINEYVSAIAEWLSKKKLQRGANLLATIQTKIEILTKLDKVVFNYPWHEDLLLAIAKLLDDIPLCFSQLIQYQDEFFT